MDPLANLAEQRRLAERIIAEADQPDHQRRFHGIAEDAERLAELVQALDQWRRNGGFDPYQYPQKPEER